MDRESARVFLTPCERDRFPVCDCLQDAEEDIAEHGDGSVVLRTADYGIYSEIEN